MSNLFALAGSLKVFSSSVNTISVLLLARLPVRGTATFLFLTAVLLLIFNPWTQKEALALGGSLVKSHVITESFRQEIKRIPFSSRQVPDNSLAVGTIKVLQEGKQGQTKRILRNLAFQGQIFTQDVVETNTIAPQDRIVAFGTKRIYSTLETPAGTLQYWQKMRVYSTSYDSKCPGCNETTATGLKAGYGVVAVDPKVIPLGTRLYVPGYGLAVAGDTGGSIKGHKIDLGFDDVKKGWWSARYTDVYLLSES
jgi:3D (Asp-Asp-Asp) domain-containing protein